jgi:hypothetical protein
VTHSRQNEHVEDNGSHDFTEHTGVGSDTAMKALISRRKLEAKPLPDSALEHPNPSRPGSTPRQQDAPQGNS